MFVGRETDLQALRRAVDERGRVHLWGPAGVGKTRLVREAYPDAKLVDLTACSTRDDVLRAIARELGLQDHEYRTLAIKRRLDRGELLVLDGVQGELDLELQCRVITTSRTARRDDALELAPLATEAAVELWSSRVRPSDPELARAIVERLDCIPLAIEWAAARAPLLGEAGCLARIETFEGDSLLQALRESLAALTADESRTLANIVAFPRGVPVDRLERVGALDTIEQLRQASLILRVGVRVRAYRAVTRAVVATLDPQEHIRIRALHADVMLPTTTPPRAELLELRDDLEAIAQGQDAAARHALLWLAPLAMSAGELNTLRKRLTQFSDDAELAIAQARLERRAGLLEEARQHATRAARKLPFESELELAHLDRQQSELESAHARLVQLVAAASNDRQRCIACGELGRVLQSMGRNREAREQHVEAIALCRTLDWPVREALERSLHARATHRGGDIAEAVRLHEQALDMHRELADQRLAAAELGHLGYCHHELGNDAEAEALFRESIEGLRTAGDVVLEHIERVLLARLLSDVGRVSEAHLELGVAATIDRAIAMPRLVFTRLYVRAWVHLAENRTEDALADLDEARALSVHAEVGFEALLEPLHQALCRTEVRILDVEQRALVHASEALACLARGEPMTIAADLLAVSSDLRRIAALESTPTLLVARDGTEFSWNAKRVDLRRRAAPRRILAVLADARSTRPGAVCSRDTLIAEGWPDEKMLAAAADKRLRTAIWTLRKAGLDDVLCTQDDGYLLDPKIPVGWIV